MSGESPMTADTGPARPPGPPVARRRTWRRSLRRDWQLYSLAVLPLLFFVIFRYLPMVGQRDRVPALRPRRPDLRRVTGSACATSRCSSPTRPSGTCSRNTLVLGALTLLFCFPLPIVLALLLNEVRSRSLKRFVQSVSYLPHFLSIVIVAAMLTQLLAVDGAVNQAIRFGRRHARCRSCSGPTGSGPSTSAPRSGRPSAGARSSTWPRSPRIDENLYEAARIDGANRWQQTWHVTLPGIRPTMMTLLILNIGTFMAVGFEKVLLLYNPLTYSDRRRDLDVPLPGRRRAPAASATPPPSACSRRSSG